ncbi:MAG: hypothetical protein ACI8W3_000254, partial [Myxococcota bacterium]
MPGSKPRAAVAVSPGSLGDSLPAVTHSPKSSGTHYRITNLALGLDESEDLLRERACESAGIEASELRGMQVARK